MIGFVYALIALLTFGSSTVFLKRPIKKLGVFPAILINYIFTGILTFISVILFSSFVIPSPEIAPLLIFEIIIGAIAILFFFKAMHEGELSIVSPVAKISVIITTIISVFFLGEILTSVHIIGIIIIVASAILVGTEGRNIKHLEKGIVYTLITAVGWGIFFALLKPLILVMGPFNVAFYTEAGIFIFLLAYILITKKKMEYERNSAISIFAKAFFVTIAVILYNFSIQEIGAALTAAFVAGSPAILVTLSRIFLKEQIPRYKYFGVAGIVIGLVILALG